MTRGSPTSHPGTAGGPARRSGRADLAAASAGALVFSLALAVATVAAPLLALQTGYDPAAVGLLAAAAAVAQLALRTVLGRVMRHVGDWVLVAASAGLLAASCALLAASAAVVPFVLAQLLQGAARACFWTGSQTHVVRGPGRAVGALATVQFTASAGLLVGPVVAGALTERSPQLALAVAAVVALAGVVPTLLLDRLPPFVPPANRPPGGIWRRRGVDAGCWACLTAGAWRGLLGSYIPVALDAARQSPSMIGLLVSAANGATLVGAALVGRVRARTTTVAFVLGTLATGLGTVASGVTAAHALAAGAALVVSGMGAGAVQTLGPAIAAEAVHPEERGDAIAVTGIFRAAAMFAAPLGIAAVLGVLTLAPAMAAVGVLTAAPALAARRIGTAGAGHPGGPGT